MSKVSDLSHHLQGFVLEHQHDGAWLHPCIAMRYDIRAGLDNRKLEIVTCIAILPSYWQAPPVKSRKVPRVL